MKNFKIYFIILFLLIFNLPAYAVDETSGVIQFYTLEECIKTALDNSPVIKKSQLQYLIKKANFTQSKSAYFPTVGVGTGYNLNWVRADHGVKNDTNAFNADANLKQLIWDFGKTNSNIRMSKFNVITAAFEYENSVLTTIFDVKTKYYAVLAAKANIDIEKSNVQINERNYQRTKAYFEEGIKSKIDLVNAEVNLSEAKISQVKAENTYKNALLALGNAMYIAFTNNFDIKNPPDFNFQSTLPVDINKMDSKKDISKLPQDVDDAFLVSKVEKTEILTDYKFQPFPYTLDECINMAETTRPDLKAYDSTLKAMEQSLLYIKREYYPEISAKAGYGYIDTNSKNSANVGVNLTSSLNILATKSKIDAAKLQVDVAKNQIDLTKQNIYFEVKNNYVDMIEYERQIPLVAVKVKQTLENLELADGRYAVGLGDYIQVQDAIVNYNKAQQSFIKTIFNYQVSRAKLEKSIALEQGITKPLEEKKK